MIPLFRRSWWRQRPGLAAAMGSLLFSAVIAAQQPVLSEDGVFYVIAADIFGSEGAAASQKLFDWLAYPALLHFLGIPFGSPEMGGRFLAAVSFAALSFYFVRLAVVIHGNGPVAWAATVAVLFLPELCEQRLQLMRDAPHWALLIGSLYYASLGITVRSWRLMALSNLLLGVAALFRFEAVFIMAALAFVWLMSLEANERRRSAVVILSMATVVGGVLLVSGRSRVDYHIGMANYLLHGVDDMWRAKTEIMASSILNGALKSYADECLIAVLAVVFFGKILSTLTPIGAIFFLSRTARRSATHLGKKGYALFGFIAIECLMLVAYVLYLQFLSSRYVMPLALGLALLALPGVSAWMSSGRRSLRATATLLAAFFVMLGLRELRVNEHEFRTAGSRMSGVPAESWWTNDRRLAYYGGKRDARTHSEGFHHPPETPSGGHGGIQYLLLLESPNDPGPKGYRESWRVQVQQSKKAIVLYQKGDAAG